MDEFYIDMPPDFQEDAVMMDQVENPPITTPSIPIITASVNNPPITTPSIPIITASVNNPPATDDDLMDLDPNPTTAVPQGHVDILELLRRLLPDKPDVNFRSEHQRTMVEIAVSRSENFVGILPTGGGKSIVFMLPALIEEGYITIVVVSNSALLLDMIRKTKDAKIPCCQWLVGSPPIKDSRLVFMALETVTSPKFKEYVHFFPYFFQLTLDNS
jgi:hypothetical protein